MGGGPQRDIRTKTKVHGHRRNTESYKDKMSTKKKTPKGEIAGTIV